MSPVAAPFLILCGLWLRFMLVFSLVRPLRLLIPGPVRALIALAVALPLFPRTITQIPSIGTVLGAELVAAGLLILPLAIVAEVLPTAGRVADVSRGAQFSEQLLPGGEQRASLLEQAAVFAVAALAFLSPLYQQIIRRIVLSEPTRNYEQFSEYLITLSTQAIATGVLIAAPIIIASLTVDGATALLSKTLNRNNMSYELLPLKLICGLLILLLTRESWGTPLFEILEQVLSET